MHSFLLTTIFLLSIGSLLAQDGDVATDISEIAWPANGTEAKEISLEPAEETKSEIALPASDEKEITQSAEQKYISEEKPVAQEPETPPTPSTPTTTHAQEHMSSQESQEKAELGQPTASPELETKEQTAPPIAKEQPLQEPVAPSQLETSTLQPSAEQPIPAAPEPPAMIKEKPIEAEKAPKPAVEEVEVEKTIGFDTLGLEKPSGNWLFKRIWWEKAETRYEKIKELVNQIMELRMKFFAKRSEVDNKILDPFYIEHSINQGQLEEIIAALIGKLQQEREETKSLTPQERALYETLVAEKNTLEQLRTDVELIQNIDIALNNALTILMEQINLCRTYENKSWEAFKDIAKVLDHEKARSLYYSMNTYLTNVKNINNYLKNAFAQYFDDLITKISTNIAQIKSTMAALQEKGINLRQQSMTSAQEQALEKTETSTAVAPAPDEVEADTEQDWISWIFSPVTWVVTKIWDLLTFWR